jgi:hypothetical protein
MKRLICRIFGHDQDFIDLNNLMDEELNYLPGSFRRYRCCRCKEEYIQDRFTMNTDFRIL